MTAYILKGREVPVEELGKHRVIRPVAGSRKGNPYSIIGFFNPGEHKLDLRRIPGGEGVSAIRYDGKLCDIDDLSALLNSEARIGSKIFARSLDENLELGNALTITGPISEVKE